MNQSSDPRFQVFGHFTLESLAYRFDIVTGQLKEPTHGKEGKTASNVHRTWTSERYRLVDMCGSESHLRGRLDLLERDHICHWILSRAQQLSQIQKLYTCGQKRRWCIIARGKNDCLIQSATHQEAG